MESTESRRWRSQHLFQATDESAQKGIDVPDGSLLTEYEVPLFMATDQGAPVAMLSERPVGFELAARRLVTTWAEFHEAGGCVLIEGSRAAGEDRHLVKLPNASLGLPYRPRCY
jgi:hypothetical protein